MLLLNNKNLIITNRERIHNILISKSSHNNTSTKIDNKFIMNAFELYDLYVFNNQIKNKLKKDGNSITFITDSKNNTENNIIFGSICTVNSILDKHKNIVFHKYEFCINVKVISILLKLKEIKQLIDVEKLDKVYCFQVILEHAIIHLLMLVWNYMYRDYYGLSSDIYTPHGKLYQCMLKHYFGYATSASFLSSNNNSSSSKIILSDIKGLLNQHIQKSSSFSKENNILVKTTNKEYLCQTKKKVTTTNSIIVKMGLLENWSNSCYIDSLLMSLFLGDSEVPNKSILKINYLKIDYKSWAPEEVDKDLQDRKKKIFKKLTTTPGFETELQMKEFTGQLQRSLISDYDKIVNSGTNFKCIETRGILAMYIPEMKPNGSNFCSYPVGDLYETIADIFPGLKMKYIPSIVNSVETGIYNKPSVIEERKSFLFWDFISPEEDEGVTPLWDIIESPMLVFQNGLVPAITDYGSINSEKVIVRGPTSNKFEIVNEKLPSGEIIRKTIPKIESIEKIIEKARVFGEYIINDRYRLFAVVRNHGTKPISSGINDFGGGHYSAYIRPFFDNQNWYNYNDMGPSWELTNCNLQPKSGNLPKDTFLDTDYSRPELLFYQKIKSSI
jgi:hypothetical protein